MRYKFEFAQNKISLVHSITQNNLYTVGYGFGYFFIHSVIASTPTCIAFGIFYKARNINDSYKIRDEILYQIIFMILVSLLFTASWLICMILKSVYPENENIISRIEHLLYVFPTCFLFAIALGMITT